MKFIVNGTVLTPYILIQDGVVAIEDGVIRHVGERHLILPDGVSDDSSILDAGGGYILPGFVDIHTHGALGIDIIDAKADELEKLCQFLPATGVTTFVPTTVTMPVGKILDFLSGMRAFLARAHPTGASIPGIHLEGPCINIEQRGAHDPNYIILPTPEFTSQLHAYADIITTITIAPELPGALEMIACLSSEGIMFSAGHCMAMEWHLHAAVEHGLRHVTHLINNMNSLARVNMRRTAGTIEAALLDDRLTAELIADRNIMTPTLFKLAVRAKGIHRLAAITDSCPLTGNPPGDYRLWGRDVVLETDKVYLLDRSAYAGSVITMDTCFRTLLEYFGISLQEAVYLTSTTPAKIIGSGSRIGALVPGADADIVLMDRSLQVQATLIHGELVYLSGKQGSGKWRARD